MPHDTPGAAETPRHPQRIFGLDVMRSAAILCVLLCHWIIRTMGRNGTPFSDNLANCLALFGVEIFFVLSGYLIGGILIRDLHTAGMNRPTIVNFWKRRWLRTLPNYYFYLALAFVMYSPWKHKTGAPLPLYPIFMQNFAWPMNEFFVLSWSLSIEEWFYLTFPLIAAAASRFTRSHKQTILTCIIIYFAVPLLLRLATASAGSFHLLHTAVIYRLDAIAFGVALAYLKRHHQTAWAALASTPVFLIGIIGIIAAAAWYIAVFPGLSAGTHPLRSALFFDLADLPCALMLPWLANFKFGPRLETSETPHLASGDSALRTPHSALKSPVHFIFTWLSILSYSLYLSNMMAIQLIGWFQSKYRPRIPVSVDILLPILITFAMSLFSYFAIEKPFLRLRDTKTSQ